MMTLFTSLGAKVAGVLALLLLIGYGIWYIQTEAVYKVETQQQVESIQQELIIRKEVNDILEENRASNPNRDGAIALERLRQRYGTGGVQQTD